MEVLKEFSQDVEETGLPVIVDLSDMQEGEYMLGDMIGDSVATGAVGVEVADSTLDAAAVDAAAGGEDGRVLVDAGRHAGLIRAALRLGGGEEFRVTDFVVNARCDVFRPDLADPWCGASDAAVLAEAVRRGRMYLEFGATTVLYAGGPGRGLRREEEVEVLVRELGGRVRVRLGDGADALTTGELAEMGAAMIDVGDSLHWIAINAAREAAARILGGGRLKA
ncbi:hypothetical protein CSOJ01_12308 [Colletotrichum sojae]|uniref:Uncharacterized protein n=1 Tax=Colletotrichum sojae TaxID=2175907 RepID=A0A8H6IVJ9_9PEZI|nr:hypothetical protein CSOJ01_12308 [Colletotrichum sojae]